MGQTSEYPKKIVYQGDTLVLITLDQVDSLNITYSVVDQYKELSDSLKSSIKEYEIVVLKDKEIIEELEKKVEIHDQILEQKNIIIQEERGEKEKYQKKNKRLKFFNKILVVAVISLGTVVSILTL